MGVLYEHWRTDTNECFYVGMSWASEDVRPYDMFMRSDDHKSIQKEVKENGGVVETRLIECSFLTKSELHQLERYQIEYWYDLIGDRLVNKASGGQGAYAEWSQEMRDGQRARMVAFLKTPEGEVYCEEHRARTKLWHKNLDEDSKESWKNSLRESSYKFLASPEGEKYCEKQRIKGLAFQASPEGNTAREADRQRKLEFYSTPEGDAFKKSESVRVSGDKNPGAKTTEETAQAILDFVGTHEEAAERFGVPVRRAKAIRERKTWRHLTPSKS